MGNQKLFNHVELESIARALADTQNGFTGSEIGRLLIGLNIDDPEPNESKWLRLQNALALDQNKRQSRVGVLAFIRRSMRPSNHLSSHDRYQIIHAKLNQALSICGLYVDDTGEIQRVTAATTLVEAFSRGQLLKIDLDARDVHSEVIRFCRDELVNENYFHAVFEATKSVSEKIRMMTGLSSDGPSLAEAALGGKKPYIAINNLSTFNELEEQLGFVNLIKGMLAMFRNVPAHVPKITWQMTRTDAADVLTICSLAHRRLDGSTVRRTVPDSVIS